MGFCVAGQCVDYPCPPGAVACTDSATVSACLADGEGDYGWTLLETCDGICKDGACVGECGYDVKLNLGKACTHWVIGLSGASGSCEAGGWLAVPSSNSDELVVFDTELEPPAPVSGSPFSTCDDPSRILLDASSETVTATCRGDGRVRRHALDGATIWDIGLPACQSARGITVQRPGPGSAAGDRLFVGCTSTKWVHELDANSGAVLDSVETPLAVYGLTSDADGVYLSDATGLAAVAPSTPGAGAAVIWSVPGAPYGLVADGAGRIWTAEAPGLVARSVGDGEAVESVEIPEVVNAPPDLDTGGCNGVALALDGRVFVGCADVGDFVVAWDPAIGQLEYFALPADQSHPRGVAVDAFGDAFSVNRGSSSVTRFSAAGGPPTSFGHDVLVGPYAYGGDLTGASNCMGRPLVQWKSPVLDPGVPQTTWVAVEWKSDEPDGTSIAVSWRIDAGPWTPAHNGAEIGLEGKTFQVRARLESETEALPTLEALAVFHE